MGKREQFFGIGVRAGQCVLADAPHAYCCPLCLRFFDEPALRARQLTLEHVPPKALPALHGRELILTCRACNNTSGWQFDAELVKLNDVRDFGMGTLRRDVPVRLQFGAEYLSSNLKAVGDEVRTEVVKKANSPRTIEAALQTAQTVASTDAWKNFSFTMHFRPVNLIGASASLLRSAYLTLFAVLGYRYALAPVLDPIRNHLADPRRTPLRGLSRSVEDANPTAKAIMHIEADHGWEAIAVRMGCWQVLLPSVADDCDFYRRVAALEDGEPFGYTVRGSLPWPTAPQHQLDFA